MHFSNILKVLTTTAIAVFLASGSISSAQAALPTGGTPSQVTNSSNSVNTDSRTAVSTAYKNVYVPTSQLKVSWNGDAAKCQAGSQTPAVLNAQMSSINFYRSLNGLDKISFTNELNAKAQSTALIMEANQTLNHFPPKTYKCYNSTGADGAGQSNLFGGSGGYVINAAADPIDAYMSDYGDSNTVVGHRRWILNPSTTTMGSGTTQSFNAVNVFGGSSNSNQTNPNWITYPNEGYSPQQLEPNGRWSISSAQGVDFSSASVTVTDSSGKALTVKKYPVANGYGPNTLVFDVTGIQKAAGNNESDYKVVVSGMKKNNVATSYTYTVKLFDGNIAGTQPPVVDNPSIKSLGDVIAKDANGDLWDYGTVKAQNRRLIGSGWNGTKSITVTDWNSDGVPDLLAQWNNGKLTVYYGQKSGGFQSPLTVGGGGWAPYTVSVGKWKAADKYPSVLARDANGALWNYPNPDGGVLNTPRTQVGAGWNGLNFELIDWDNNGKIDILAVNSRGQMLLYRTDGKGAFLNESRPVVGAGWNGYSPYTVKDFNGSGTQGILARDSSGILWYYGIQNGGGFIARYNAGGGGWNPYLIAEHG